MRERILEEALRLFSEKGFRGARTSEIASRAGVAEGSLYHHFRDKKDLFIACVEPAVEDALRRASADLGRAGDRQAAVRALVESRMTLIEDNMDRFNILFSEAPFHPRLWEMLYENVLEAWASETSTSGLSLGGDAGSPMEYLILGFGITTFIWTALNIRKMAGKTASSAVRAASQLSREDIIDDLTSFLLHGMSGPAPEGGGSHC